MTVLHVFLIATLAVSGFAHLGLGLYVWRAHPTPLGRTFALAMLATGCWVACFTGSLFGPSASFKLISHTGIYALIPIAAAAWYLCILHFTAPRSGPTPRLPRWTVAAAGATAVLSLTSGFHGWFLRDLAVVPWGSFLLVRSSPGPAFLLHLININALMALTLWRLGRAARDAENAFCFRRALALFILSLIPTLFTALFFLGLNPIPGYGLAPFLLAPVGVAQWLLLFRFGLFDLVPIARDTLFRSLSEAVLVFDHRDRLIDSNPATATLFGLPHPPPIGTPLGQVLPHPAWSAWLQAPTDSQVFALDVSAAPGEAGPRTRALEASLQTVLNEQDRPIGRYLMLRDVSARHRIEQALRESEARHRALMEGAGLPLLLVDHEQHRIVYANPAALDWSGYGWDDLVGQPPQAFYRDPATRGSILAELASSGRIDHREVVFFLSDGREATTLMSVRALDHQGRRAALVTLIDVTEMRRAEAAWRAIELRNRELMVTEHERQRIGRDLHDDLGQQLTGLGLLVAALRQRLGEKGYDDATVFNRLQNTLAVLVRKTRTLAHGLNPVALHDTGLWYALRELADATATPALVCSLSPAEPVYLHDAETALQLFRIAQEAVSNACRHARARRIGLILTVTADEGSLVIEDDGVGLPAAAATPSAGHGLAIMRFRAGLIGGALTVDATPAGGTRVACRFPLDRRSPASAPGS